MISDILRLIKYNLLILNLYYAKNTLHFETLFCKIIFMMKQKKIDFCDYLKSKGLTYSKFAKLIGVSRSYLYAMEYRGIPYKYAKIFEIVTNGEITLKFEYPQHEKK